MTTYYRKHEDGSVMDFSAGQYADDCLITEKEIVRIWDGRYFVEDEQPEMPQDVKDRLAMEEAKRVRAETVSGIKVTVDGMVFDGDEIAQGRMGRTIAACVAKGYDLDTTMRTWVLADNTVAQVSVRQLAQALELAGDAQTAAWTVPYN